MQGNKATARATKPPRLSDHNERKTFTMATETVPNIVRGHVPYDDAHECSDMLFDVLSLLYAALQMQENCAAFVDKTGLTDGDTLLANIIIQARKKTEQVIQKLDI